MTDTIKQTAKKWTDIAVNGGMDNGYRNCPLCEKYLRNFSCGSCPIKLAGHDECGNDSIYLEWKRHQKSIHGSIAFPFKAQCPICTEIAMRFATWILTLKEEPEKPKIEYPCVMVSDLGTIVLFEREKVGRVISEGNGRCLYGIGHYSESWAMESFKPCKITVEVI